jgi:uncharacterized protein (DUF302 family)
MKQYDYIEQRSFPVRFPGILRAKALLLVLFTLLAASLPVAAQQDDQQSPQGIYRQQVNKPLAAVYDKLYKSLEEANFFVVFEPDIGANLSRFSEKWGDDYNKNKLTAFRSMVFCNGWYANQVSNLDPDMLGFCPLHLSLVERDGQTTVLFNRPSVFVKNSPASGLFINIENEVIEAIKQGLK